MGFFPEFHETSPDSLGSSPIIAYKPYPKAREFHEILWDFHENFMGKPCPIPGRHGSSWENS
jgi:hypothetical protein